MLLRTFALFFKFLVKKHFYMIRKPILTLLFAAFLFHFPLSAQINFKPVEGFSCGSDYEFLAVGDLNNDKRDDVVVATGGFGTASSDNSLNIFLQTATGDLSSPDRLKYSTSQTIRALTLGDVNNDGLQDIIVGLGDTIKVFTQKPNHSFSLDKKWVGGRFVDDLKVGDLNNDGLNDIVASHYPDDNLNIYYQQADKSFVEKNYIVPAGGRNKIELGDLNCDGRTDILLKVGQINPGLYVLMQDNDGIDKNYLSVRLPSATNVFWGIKIGDINNDGQNDIVATLAFNSPNSKLYIWYQDAATHRFKPPVVISTYEIPEEVTIGDFDNDKRNDIAIVHGGWIAYSIYSQNCAKELTETLRGYLPYSTFYKKIETIVVGNDGKTDLVTGTGENKFFFLDNDSKEKKQRFISRTGTTTTATESITLALDSIKTVRTDTVTKWVIKTTTVTTYKTSKNTVIEHQDSVFIVFDSLCMKRDTLVKRKCTFKNSMIRMDTSVKIRHDTVFWTTVATVPFRENDLNIYPNPTQQQLFFRIENPLNRQAVLNIYAFDGRLVLSQKTVLQAENILPIPLLTNGLYLLEIKNEQGHIAKKFTVSQGD